MTMNSSGPISLGGSTTGQSINLEIGQTATQSVSLNQTAVRALAGRTTAGSSVAVPTNFYNKYYFYLLGSTVTTPYSYSLISQQGGTGNGSEALSGPAPGKENGGYRSGDRYFPIDGTYGTQFTNYCYPFNVNDAAGLSTFRTLITTTYNLMFSSVSSITVVGGVSSFTATLNSGYHFCMCDAADNARTYCKPGTVITFTNSATQTGVWGGAATSYITGSQYFYGYLNQGLVWANTTGYTGTVYSLINISGVSKVCNVRVSIDDGTGTTILFESTQGQTTTGYAGNLGPYNVINGSSILLESYWWGAGGSFTNSSYVSSGTYKIGYTVSNV